jgi:hypothetical protein
LLDTSKRVGDSLFPSVAVLLSLALYLRGLGFNSDDWAFLGKLSTSPEPHNVVDLTRSLFASTESLVYAFLPNYSADRFWLGARRRH